MTAARGRVRRSLRGKPFGDARVGRAWTARSPQTIPLAREQRQITTLFTYSNSHHHTGTAKAPQNPFAGEAVPSAGGADRFDGDRGGHQASDRRRVCLARRQGASKGGSQAGEAGRGEALAGAGSLGSDKREVARDRAHYPSPLGRGAKAEVLKLTAETGELLERSVTEARRLVATAKRKARGGVKMKPRVQPHSWRS